MFSYLCCVALLTLICTAFGQYYEVEQPDGSYKIGQESNSVGTVGDTVASYLRKDSGWTEETRSRNEIGAGISLQVPQVPYIEILKLVEAFLRLKGDLGGKLNALIQDNRHIISAVFDTLVRNISSIHKLTLTSIVVLRKIIEFAGSLLSNVNFDVNAGPGGINFSSFFGRR